MLEKEQNLTKKLKSEITKAKDVLMSSEMSLKAHYVFKKFVAINDDERIFLDNGSLHDLIEKDKNNRQTFEYEGKERTEKHRNKIEKRKCFKSNQIKFRNLSDIQGITSDTGMLPG